MGFTPGILKAIKELGFEHPMPVQEKVIPEMLSDNRDIIALAQTGTGKTAAFGLPLVQTMDVTINTTQALILCPTRELCLQITNDLNDFARFTGKLKIQAVYGGASIENQIRGLRQGAQIIVATPGRLIDLAGRKAAKLSTVKTVILDEADEMLNMGFLDSINEILEEVPDGRRTLLFSATMSSEIASIAGKYMHDAVEITIGTRNSSPVNLSHAYYLVHAKDKYKVLKRIADSEPDIYGIIFCRTRKDTQEIASKLIDDGYNADALHGDLSQAQRDTVMQKFRLRNIRLLVATDVAARGLDVDDLTHVINYSLPEDTEVYTHRSGRTGRAGKKGVSISIVHLKEKHLLHEIERKVKKPFKAMTVPTGKEICEKQLFNWVSRLENVETSHHEIEKILPEIKEKLSGLDREELLRRVVSLQFDRFLDDYRNGEEIISPVTFSDTGSSYKGKRGKKGQYPGKYTRLFINLGKADGFYPEQLIDLINSNTRGIKIPIGKIDLMRSFSFFEVEEGYSDDIISSLRKARFMNRKVVVEIAQEKPSGTETRAGKRKKDNTGNFNRTGSNNTRNIKKDRKKKKHK